MSGASQAWLVALREVRERGRSRSLLAGLAATLVIVVAMIVAPALLDPDDGTREVGVTGETPAELAAALRSQGDATDVEVAVRLLDDLAEGREALREEDVDVLVVDARTLEWRERPDEQLQAVVTGAIQLVVVQERAVAAGISPDQLLGLVAPVPVDNVEIGLAEGRSPEDSTVAIAITALLLMAVYVYGVLVLTGVVEEKSSRVVEVLLARMSPRDLLIGKVAGIGLLGLAQFVLTALVAVVTLMLVDSVDLPALGNTVLGWVVAWFVLGYALYAVAYGALGSLASRTEDAQSVAGPVGYVLIAAYWASFLAISDDPDGGWSQVVSLFPATAPFAMPARIALGAHAWWEPFAAVALTVVAIAGLISFGGRVYTGAVLHSGPTLHLRDAWRRSSPAPAAGR